MVDLKDICNNNTLNNVSQSTYDAFNNFIFSEDIKVLGKLLHRFEWFLKVKDLPGDIIEIGVFKGSGIATFLKFIQIYCPNSNKKVIGFDIFDAINSDEVLNKDSKLDQETMRVVYNKVDSNELSLQSVSDRIDNTEIDSDKYRLIKGDVAETLPKFNEENPGFRASLIYIDVDLERPTYYALRHLWDRLLPGGVILFDEYEYHKFSESNGVERFLKEIGLNYNLKSTNWIAPTAYIVKDNS
jgi:hypothetical protein